MDTSAVQATCATQVGVSVGPGTLCAMSSFNGNDQDQARDADGKFASTSTAGTDPAVLNRVRLLHSIPIFTAAGRHREELPDGGHVEYTENEYGSREAIYYNSEGQIHRDGDQPAIVSNSVMSWMKNDRLDRDPQVGPALIHSDGQCVYGVDDYKVEPGDNQCAKNDIISGSQYGKRKHWFQQSAFGQSGDDGEYSEDGPRDGELDQLPQLAHYFHEHDPEWDLDQL